jgi:hypothetical protein
MEFPFFPCFQIFVEHVNLENNIGIQEVKFVQQLSMS